ncbi:MAG: amidohydrolase family protein [Rhizobiaceae bacterium]
MKIIDCHAHMATPPQLAVFKASILSHRGAHGAARPPISEEMIRQAFTRVEMAPVGHLACLEQVGVDMQLISPRPFQLMHSEQPKKLVHWYVQFVNDIIAQECKIYPDKFVGVAGLPQAGDSPIEEALPELERCVKEHGFRGCLINPDPFENDGRMAPPMGDRYWYPLYEKLCELDVVGHIHSASSRAPDREPYSLHFINEETTAVYGLVKSSVLDDFPDLKILVSHGGGAIPYQVGRFDATSVPRNGMVTSGTRFRDKLRKLYFDTVLYNAEAIELLVKVVGPSQCLYGAEMPGVGSSIDPDTGRTFDDIIPHIRALDFITEEEKEGILGGNAVKLFRLQDYV